MLEKPDLDEALILDCLAADYGISGHQIDFLPLGADLNTAVYAIQSEARPVFFLKLRYGVFDKISVTLPKYLNDLGLSQIISPLKTITGRLWTDLDPYNLTVYPYIEGQNGYQVPLPPTQWAVFGAAMKEVHTVQLPARILKSLREETYSQAGRETVRRALDRAEVNTFQDEIAAKLAHLLSAEREVINDMIARADRLVGVLQENPPPFVLCHSDLHAGNLHITETGEFYIVDWDEPLLAPKERDLMFIGGGLMGPWQTPEKEKAWFYKGYGPTAIDPAALAYYRYERILQDIAVYCRQILTREDGGEDREQSLRYLKKNFLPGGTIEMAYNFQRAGWLDRP